MLSIIVLTAFPAICAVFFDTSPSTNSLICVRTFQIVVQTEQEQQRLLLLVPFVH